MSWGRVQGHDRLVSEFQEVVSRGRLAHAYLFVGPHGIGKHLFAEELAKAIFCENPPPGRLEACEHCNACRLVAGGAHPDQFHAGRREEQVELPIETIRELTRQLALKPARGKYKIAIVDDADDMNEPSANCFLKTLEEPPARSLLILIGTSAERQLATIVSRCQIIRFRPLSEGLVARLLAEQGIAEGEMAERLAHLSEGSLGQAQALALPELWEFRSELVKAISQDSFDVVAMGQTWMRFIEEAGKEGAPQRERAHLVLRLLVEFLHDALRVASGAPSYWSEAADQPALAQIANRAGVERLLGAVERCLEAEYHLDRRVQLVLAVEALADALGQSLP